MHMEIERRRLHNSGPTFHTCIGSIKDNADAQNMEDTGSNIQQVFLPREYADKQVSAEIADDCQNNCNPCAKGDRPPSYTDFNSAALLHSILSSSQTSKQRIQQGQPRPCGVDKFPVLQKQAKGSHIDEDRDRAVLMQAGRTQQRKVSGDDNATC